VRRWRRSILWRQVKKMRKHIAVVLGIAAVLAIVPLSCRNGLTPIIPGLDVPERRGPTVRPVRVVLAENVPQVQIAIAGPTDVRNALTDRTLDRTASIPDGVVRATATGFAVGGRTFPGSTLDLIPTQGTSVVVNGRRYRGSLRLIQRAGGAFHVINVVPMEHYIASVINGEMPSGWPTEALKAQAVAARTYALYEMEQRRDSPFDVWPDERSQVYPGEAGETERSRQIAGATARIVLLYDDRVFCTYFSSTCGGQRQDVRFAFEQPSIPPLAGGPCAHCQASPRYRWQEVIGMGELSASLEAALRRGGRSVGEVQTFQIMERAPSGHVARIKVQGSSGAIQMRGTDFRLAVGARRLPSTNFQIQPVPNAVRFVGCGFGHGVGLCQYGAKGAAEAGLDFLRILSYYYPHSTAVRLPAAA
jgi:stage II sporulation protein D